MMYIKNLFLSLKEVFILMICQYVILIASVLVLGINKSLVWGTILLSFFELIFILFIFRKKRFRYKNDYYFPYLLLGISLAVIYNMLLFRLGIVFEPVENINIMLVIISSGIIGPIFEEILFRYFLLNNLNKFNSPIISIVLSGIIFGLFHNNLITAIYATILGIINAYLYVRKNNLLIPILVHISANIMTQLLIGYNLLNFILGCVLFLLSILIIKIKKEI